MRGSQMTLGVGMIMLTTVVHVVGLIGLAKTLPQFSSWTLRYLPRLSSGLLLLAAVLWIIAIHIIEVWIWALVYIQIGEFNDFGSALYFSTVTATTLGYGDLVLSQDWQLLSAFEAMGGLILFGASTAFLISLMGHLFKQMQDK